MTITTEDPTRQDDLDAIRDVVLAVRAGDLMPH